MPNNPIIPALNPPRNPFWEVFRTFGRDELTGGFIALVATAIIEAAFHLYNDGAVWGAKLAAFGSVQLLVLALAGPVLEKVGFFFWHFKEARDTYSSTPALYREPFGFYIKQALKGGGKTLMWDILLHDPLYIGLMLLGMHIHPATPAWLLVPVAFGLAVVAVAVLEVGINELRYLAFQRRITSFVRDFRSERYYDARFYLASEVDPDEAVKLLRGKFFPDAPITLRNYQDLYYPVTAPSFNGREGLLRVRNRDREDGTKICTVQYVYSRAIEKNNALSQFRCFPRLKEKFYRTTSGMDHASRIAFEEAKKECAAGDPLPTIVQFQRKMVYTPDTLLLAVDQLCDDQGTPNGPVMIEVKVYPDKLDLLIEAMHFIMHQFPAKQTTDPKIHLLEGPA